jgi:two-component system sensor histidine kinase KdpD
MLALRSRGEGGSSQMDLQFRTTQAERLSTDDDECEECSETSALEAALVAARAQISSLEFVVSSQARDRADLINLVSHELRTPITVISGFSRLLQDPAHGPLNESQDHFVTETLKACRRLDFFVGDLLEACPESGTPLSIAIEVADLEATIRSIFESLAPLLAERGLQVELDLDASIDGFRFDASRIEQVVTNMLTNAIRYGRAGGRLCVASVVVDEAGGRFVRVSVEDDGPGIPVENRSRIFDPYVRGTGHDEATGLGIGLAICERIVAAHGGAIGIEDGSLGGARFVFSLPYAPCNVSNVCSTEGR